MAVPNSDISKYIDCSVSSDNSETDPFKCPFHPEAGCTLSRIIYNSIKDGIKQDTIDVFKQITDVPKREEMLCNIDNELLVDKDNNIVKIPVYTYRFKINSNSNSAYKNVHNILSVGNCSDLNDFTIEDNIQTFVESKDITYEQSDIDYNLKTLNLSTSSKDEGMKKMRDACNAQKELQDSLIPISKEQKIHAEKILKIASNLSSQYSNDIAYNITNNVLNKNIPIKAYETTMNTTPASVMSLLTIAAVEGAFDNSKTQENYDG